MRAVLVVLLAAVPAVHCQALWVSVDALSTPCRGAGLNVTFTAADFLEDGRHGWVVGTYRAEAGPRVAVLRTTDGRRTWTATWTDIDATPAGAVDFIDANHGWMIAGGTTVHRTTDGGRTWTQEDLVGGVWSLLDLEMANATNGYIAGWVWPEHRAAVLQYHADRGLWQQIHTLTDGELPALSVYAADALWAAGLSRAGAYLGCRRAGAEWLAMSIPSSVAELSFPTGSRGFAACTSGRVFETTDAGASWREKPTPVFSALDDILFPSGSKGMALSASGELVIGTEDTGNTWVVERAPANAVALLWDGSTYLVLTRTGLFAHATVGRVIPSVQPLQRRSGSGVGQITERPGPYVPAWHRCRAIDRARGDATFTAASFADDNRNAWVLTADGGLLHTASGGVSWERIELPREIYMPLGITFTDARNGWLWGGSPCIWRTRDGGRTWASENVDGGWNRDDLVLALEALGAESGVAAARLGGRGPSLLLSRAPTGVWTITDNSVPYPGQPRLAALGSPDPRAWSAWVMSSAWNGLRSQPCFPRMEHMGLGTDRDLSVRSVFFVSPVEGWVCADISIYVTADGGRTWRATLVATPDPANYPIDVAFKSPTQGYAITRLGRVLASRDGGATWAEAYRAERPNLISVHWFGGRSDSWWVLGEDALYTNTPEPETPTLRPHEPARPHLAEALLSWSAEGPWGRAGVSPATGQAGREAVFRVRWDARNAGAPRELQVLIQAPGAAFPSPVALRPVNYWDAQEHSGAGDWAVGYTPSVAGSYNYRFRGASASGHETTGPPTEWMTWTVR